MDAVRTRTFKSGNSEAIRLPKELAFGIDTEVEITRDGTGITIRPVKLSPAEMVRRLRELPSPDYVEERDTEEIPEPKGL